MMRLLAVALAVLAACAEKTDTKPEAKPAVRPEPPPPPAARPKLDGLAVTLPDGWTQRYLADSDLQIFEKKLPDLPPVLARIGHAPRGVAADADGYAAAKLRAYDKGSKMEILAKETVPGGYLATTKVTAAVDPNRPKLEMFMVWDVAGDKLLCESDWVPTEAVRDEIVALCKSARR